MQKCIIKLESKALIGSAYISDKCYQTKFIKFTRKYLENFIAMNRLDFLPEIPLKIIDLMCFLYQINS